MKKNRFVAISKFLQVAQNEQATRIEKIHALTAVGHNIDSKANSKRVNSLFEIEISTVSFSFEKEIERRRNRNRRKRQRKAA